MDVILINPPSLAVEDDRLDPPLGLLYIASNLLHNQIANIRIRDLSGCCTLDDIQAKIESLDAAAIYGISCYSTSYQYVKRIVRHIRNRFPDSVIVLGGAHATACPESTLADTGADAVVCGEGEDVFLDIVKSYSHGRKMSGIFHGIRRPEVDSFPFPARLLVNYSSYSRKLEGKPAVALISSRGCRHHCIHCNSVIMGGGRGGVQYRSAKNILAEMELLRPEFDSFRFNDDHFTGNPGLSELLVQLKSLNINFRIFARVEDLSPVLCRALNDAGCRHVTIGLESLIPENLRFLGKVSQIGCESNIRHAKQAGLTVRASFMVGLPHDTDDLIVDSFNRAAQLDLDEFAIYPLIPYPGTLIAKTPERFGYRIVDPDFTNYIQMGRTGKTCFALQHERFSSSDVRRWFEMGSEILSSRCKHMSQSTVA